MATNWSYRTSINTNNNNNNNNNNNSNSISSSGGENNNDDKNNRNLCNLIDPDEDDITEELSERFERGIHYVRFGDGVIAMNPQTGRDMPENSHQNGRRYCSRKPEANLPPHVYALAHKVYKDVLAEGTSQSILISGFPGSGKSEVFEMVLRQFQLEAGRCRGDGNSHILMKAMSILKRLTTFQTVNGPTSSAASALVTLFFGRDGTFKTARIKLHLLNARHATPCTQGQGYLNIFYDLVAALQSDGYGLSAIDNTPRILQMLDPALTQISRDAVLQHSAKWMKFVDDVNSLGIGENKPSGRHGLANSFLDCLLALVLLAGLEFGADQHSKQIRLVNVENFILAAKLLGIPGPALFEAVVIEASKFGAPPPGNATQSRDQLVQELYSRLIQWLQDQINNQFPDLHSDYIPIHIADLPSFSDKSIGDLDTLCQNMVAECLQVIQNKAVFNRELDACREAGLKSPVVKIQKCDHVVDLAFRTPNGLLNQLEVLCHNPALSDEAVSATLDKQFKRSKDRSLYISAKHAGAATFGIVHSHKQVNYQITPMYRYQNIMVSNREAQKLLAASGNATVKEVFKPAIKEFSDPNARTQFSYITYMKIQLNTLIDTLEGSVPNLIRCIKPCARGSTFDEAFVKPQIKAACLADVIRQKRYGFSHWMTVTDFLRRYGVHGILLSVNTTTAEDACKTILEKVGIWEKGPVVTKKFVFLLYWHKQNLDAILDELVWKITLIQAGVRGRLVRKRLHDVRAAQLRKRDQLNARRHHANQHEEEAREDHLYQNIVSRTVERSDDLPSSTWAKVVYLEQGRELAKVYAEGLSLLVTGSRDPFDGVQLGLSSFRNPYRVTETQYLLEQVQRGIELRRDSDGSLLVKRHCLLPVYVKKRHCDPVLSADVLRTGWELLHDHFMKIFDMQEFQSLIGLEMRKGTFSKTRLRKMCIVTLSFGVTDVPILDLPCAVAIVNMFALNKLDDNEELKTISLMTSQMALRNMEIDERKSIQEEAKMRRQRKHWSKIDQRPHLQMREANARKIREELRKRGEKISDHMKYSWEEETERNHVISMDQLYESMTRQPAGNERRHGNAAQNKKWARIDVALREASRELLKEESENVASGNHWSI